MSAGAVSSWPPAGTAAARPTRSTRRRRTLQTGADLLTDKQKARLAALFAVDAHAEVEATWTMYQRTVAAYREPDRKTGPHHDGRADHHAEHRRSQSPAGADHPRTDTQETRRRRPGLLRPARHHPTDRPKRSTAASNTSADPPWDSATSPTTSPDRYWKPADSDPNYTLNHEEPVIFQFSTPSMIHFLTRKSLDGKAIHLPKGSTGHPASHGHYVTVTECCAGECVTHRRDCASH